MSPVEPLPGLGGAVTGGREPVSDPPTRRLSGWGGVGAVDARCWRPRDAEELTEAIASRRIGWDGPGTIARGRGRSYGDAAQRTGGLALDLTALRQISLDATTGTVIAGAGVTLGRLLATVISAGWILPVVPGTQHVTVGGAIAADIHGKNHGTALTFSRHVVSLTLLTSQGTVLELERDRDDPRFAATTGGMGLTGLVLSARIQLRRVRSGMLSVDIDRAADLDQAFALLDEGAGSRGAHRVAWLDLLTGAEPRGVVTRADHVESDDGTLRPGIVTTSARARVPAGWPGVLLRVPVVRAHNELRFRLAPHHERGKLEPFGPHMFPLDVLDCWPRLYGRAGFLQYQFVVPRGAESTIRAVLALLRRERIPCFLAVLKDFGDAAPGHLSFPIAGWTLALDLPAGGRGLGAALQRCDELVAGAGGRVYFAKDGRLSPEMTRAMYPRLAEWRRVRDELDPDGLWRSDLAVRTELVES
jgi:decaprenylphospho-beta-D-ribofuranose 2-oxidase